MKNLFSIAALTVAVSFANAANYEADIAPILRTYCAGCHNDTDLEGDLSMETFASLRKGGEKGDPLKADEKGLLFLRVIEATGKGKMPPKDEPQLTAEELATLKKWIAAGAPGPAKDESLFKKLVVPKTAPRDGRAMPVTAAAFSPEATLLAVGQGNAVEIRNAGDGTVVKRLETPGKVNAVHFSPDGKQIIAATGVIGLNGSALVWNVGDGALVRELAGARDTLYDAEFSPDGKVVVTAGYDRVIRFYDAADGKLIRSLDIHKGAIFDLAFSLDGKVLASASADFTVKLWRVSDGERLDTLNQPLGEQTAVLFTRDGGHIVSAGADKRIHLWRFVSKEKPMLNPLVTARFAHESAVSGLMLSADGKSLVSSAEDRTVKVWSLPALAELQAWPARPAASPVLAALPASNRFIAARMDGVIDTLEILTAKAAGAPQVVKETIVPTQAAPTEVAETEPNDMAAQAVAMFHFPAAIKGSIGSAGDLDHFRFHAKAGQQIILDVDAASAKSKIDSHLEVLTAEGKPVEQVVLQSVKESWFTFRGKDSMTSDDFRIQNWREIELDEFLYCNGEVVKLWHYPRGPDSGFRVYPGTGNRITFFQTTPTVHPLGEYCYIVEPLPPGSQPPPNGLPIFRLNFENDDEPNRRGGSDSLLVFTAPREGDYIARIKDVRGFGGEKEHHYTLRLRNPEPSFTATLAGKDPKISPGGGREFTVSIVRSEGMDGPVTVDVANLPPGFATTAPLIIEASQTRATGVIYANDGAADPDEKSDKAVVLTARAMVDGREFSKTVGDLGNIVLGPKAKLSVEILPQSGEVDPAKPLEFTIRPGETITARVRAKRYDFKGRISFGEDSSGRNLPYAVFVDNIGLNGLMIVEGQTEREFSITASPVALPGERMFHLRASDDGGQASRPAKIRVIAK